ncbi:hypothetical protein Tco_1484669 [Tanacetum coccineum]
MSKRFAKKEELEVYPDLQNQPKRDWSNVWCYAIFYYTNLGLGIVLKRLTIELADRTLKQPRGFIHIEDEDVTREGYAGMPHFSHEIHILPNGMKETNSLLRRQFIFLDNPFGVSEPIWLGVMDVSGSYRL